MNANKELREKGDFTRIAGTMRASGAALVADLGVEARMKVLDRGCGDGTTALPAAERGAEGDRRRHRRLVAAGRPAPRPPVSTTCASRGGDASSRAAGS